MNKRFSLLLLGMAMTFSATAQTTYPYQDTALTPEQRADDLIGRLTLEEKARLMIDVSDPVERLGIPQFQWWNEALHGIARNGYNTVFPITMGMAASWDDALLYRCFDAASDEARIKYRQAKASGQINRYQGLSFWTPNINIFRDPRWGRGQETYGEDPYLTTCMGLAVVRGLEGPKDSKYKKLLACAKHYAVHSGPEWNRHTFNIEDLPERDLWETYLPAFKALVQEGDVAEVMCAYQRIDGQPCCGQTRYLQQILRGEWGFKGIVVSDCGAIRDFHMKGHHEYTKTPEESVGKAVLAGTDNNCGSVYKAIPAAVKAGEVSEKDIDVSLKRLLVGRFRLGELDPDSLVPWMQIPEENLCSKAHSDLAYRMAQESMVLLQNRNNILPLNKDDVKIAVIGPNANDSVMQWGNYSGYPVHTVTILDGIRSKAGKNAMVKYINGSGHTSNSLNISHFKELYTRSGKPGVEAVYWNNKEQKGTPVAAALYTNSVHLDNGGNTVFAPGVELENFSAAYSAVFTPENDGIVTLSVKADDGCRIIVNGDTVYNKFRTAHGMQSVNKDINVVAGRNYDIQVDYLQVSGMAHFEFDVYHKLELSQDEILAQTADADVVVFAGGISPRLEGEEMKVSAYGFKGGDRTDIQLPQCQRDLIKAIHDSGKRIVYVNCSGSAVALVPETENCDAILQAWYPGERGGDAVADVLFGDYNPSGKLPVTFYRSVDDLPDFLDYRMDNRTYRYFQGSPLWHFGYGLSYTQFRFSKPRYKDGKMFVTVENAGDRDGEEVVQIYIKRIGDTDGPIKTLKAFRRISVEAGQKTDVVMDLPRDAFECWDKESNTMRVIPGKYNVMVGNSSRSEDLQSLTVTMK
ncbi:MAG: glycoside hydrolase family 3 C-terminal domain-containing protein [Bacteroidales bacterium]|nr:glycoside hydrolase family 3 C-terminal domain-containing protein [Bacteroidales bacterium]MCM1146309.1 glycoside hydrolase family 3 C-terminal domain-containing protein [Bacteroidales bacterium]MCM1205253.1 glycoside hydrolase family 3 C-terminal domain-containing protein [Bacillota bacterium]MCM1509662.1 glycoside hydrolase family 3 C-terminal domain-containing protein [Clostridium sp.]